MNENNILGLDLSLTGSGVVVLNTDAEVVHHDTIRFKPATSEMTKTKSGKTKTMTDGQKIQRLSYVTGKVHEVVLRFQPKTIGIEGYAFSRNSKSVTGLAELGGAIRVELYRIYGLVPFTIPVSRARKFVIGKGNITKAKAHIWLDENMENHGLDGEDEKDAFIIATTLYYAVNPKYRAGLRLEQLEHLDDVVKTLIRAAGKPIFMED